MKNFQTSSFEKQNEKINELKLKLDQIINEAEQSKYFYLDKALVIKCKNYKNSLEEFLQQNPKLQNSELGNNLNDLCKIIEEHPKIIKLSFLYELNDPSRKIEFSKLNGKHDLTDDRASFDDIDFKIIKTHKKNCNLLIDFETTRGKSQNPPNIFQIKELENFNQKQCQIMEEAKRLIYNALWLFSNDHKVDKPIEILKTFYEMGENYKNDEVLTKFFNEILNEKNQDLKDIRYQYDIVETLIKEADADDWIHETTKGNIKVFYKVPKDHYTKTCSLKFESELHLNLINLISIIYDNDLMHLWVPFCKIGKTIKKINKACKVFYNEMDLPVISNRELYSLGIGINKLDETGSIFILSKTIDKDEDFLGYHNIDIPEKTKCIRMEVIYFSIEIIPYSEDHCKIRMLANLDAKVKLIPYSIINFIARKFAVTIFEKIIRKATDNFDQSPWFKSIKAPENREFFQWVEKLIHSINHN